MRLTDTALAQAKHLSATTPEWSSLALRVYLEGKGCDGFFYGVTFDQPTKEDIHFPHTTSDFAIDIVVDPDTIEFVDGSTIDWVDDERGKGFLVENPSHRAFRGKFFKRSAWQEKLQSKLVAKVLEKTAAEEAAKS